MYIGVGTCIGSSQVVPSLWNPNLSGPSAWRPWEVCSPLRNPLFSLTILKTPISWLGQEPESGEHRAQVQTLESEGPGLPLAPLCDLGWALTPVRASLPVRRA